MSQPQVYQQTADNSNVVDEYIKTNFRGRKYNRFHSEGSGISERRGRSRKDRKKQALKKELETKSFPPNDFGKLEAPNEMMSYNKNYGRYVILDHKTDVSKIPGLFFRWGMMTPDVILSVLSTDESIETYPTKTIQKTQNIRTPICKSIVKLASTIGLNAWIITGGLNKGVDQLIGKCVRQRLANNVTIPKAVLGISNWGCLEDTTRLLNETGFAGEKIQEVTEELQNRHIDIRNDAYACMMEDDQNAWIQCETVKPISLNQYLTHSLLVTDGTEKEANHCQAIFREKLEISLTTENESDGWSGVPLIYILIGGSLEEFGLVERALDRGSPVIVTLGTGGASEIIYAAMTTKEGSELQHLPDIFVEPFNRLIQWLNANNIPLNLAEDVIDNIKAMKLKMFCKIFALLDKINKDQLEPGRLEIDIANMNIRKAYDPLPEIKELIYNRVTSRTGNHSAVYTEVLTVSGIRAVFKKLLVVSGINRQLADQGVDSLESDILIKMLSKFRQVYNALETIRKHNRKESLLLTFNVHNREQRRITSFIVEALRKVKLPRPSCVYTLAADWNDERSFTKLLRYSWKPEVQEGVFRKLIRRKDKNRYVQLMLQYMDDNRWLMKSDGPLEADFEKNKQCKEWMDRFHDKFPKRDYKAERLRGKMLFLWSIQKEMPETAMLFWTQGQDCLAMLLVAYKELRKQQKAIINEEARQQKRNQMQYFEKLALDFLTNCYANSKKKTLDLLVGKVEDLDNVTPLQLAVDVKLNAFLYAEPTEFLLNRIWTKNIKFYNTDSYFLVRYIPMILSMVCPLLAPAFLKFPSDDDSNIRLPRIGLSKIQPLPECSAGDGIEMPADNRNDELQNGTTSQRLKYRLRTYLSKLELFTDTPLVIFLYWFISYLAYITLFSIVLLTDFRAKISATEIVLTVWTATLIIEEIRQFVVGGCEYIKNKWNQFDILALALYLIGFIMRMIYHGDPAICPHCLYHARIVMAFSLTIFFLRTLQFLSVYESVGPKIFMMNRLIFADLIPFLLILTVFVSAYGVVSNVILYPNQPLNGKLLKDVFYDAWWSVIQQFNRDDALGSNCNKDNDSAIITAEYCSSTTDDNIDYERCKENQCPANNWIVSVLLAFYALVTCIMLLNVLIAMFNETFKSVDNRQKDISTMLRYQLIREYSSNLKVHPLFRLIFVHMQVPPPFCVICYPLYILCKCRRIHTTRKTGSQYDAFEIPLTRDVKIWQDARADDYFNENQAKEEWLEYRMDSETSDIVEDKLTLSRTKDSDRRKTTKSRN